jgi:hypothetical protein
MCILIDILMNARSLSACVAYLHCEKLGFGFDRVQAAPDPCPFPGVAAASSADYHCGVPKAVWVVVKAAGKWLPNEMNLTRTLDLAVFLGAITAGVTLHAQDLQQI